MRAKTDPTAESKASSPSHSEALTPVFEVKDLHVHLGVRSAQRHILKGVSLKIPPQKTTVILGESASGKSVLLRTLLGLHRDPPGAVAGEIHFCPPGGERKDLLEGVAAAARYGRWRRWQVDAGWVRNHQALLQPFRGATLGYIGQLGSAALDPTRPVGQALIEALKLTARERHETLDARAVAVERLRSLDFDRPEEVLRLYPSELSGGMAQRVSLAVTLARRPQVLFADEPTTGLDPDSQEALLQIFLSLKRAGIIQTLILVTHDLGVAQRLADEVVVMGQGQVVEVLEATRFFGEPGPQHPLSCQLKRAFDEFHARTVAPFPAPGEGERPRLEVLGLSKQYLKRTGLFGREKRTVIENVALSLYPGQVMGLVGPSGHGKTTLASCIVKLVTPDAGSVRFEGQSVLALEGGALRLLRRQCQLLFQHPAAALHPNLRVEDGLMETARYIMGLAPADARQQVTAVLEQVHLNEHARNFPHQLSGGQLRRVGLARVLLLKPSLLIADEPTAGIDASLRAGILTLLEALTTGEQKTSVLLISHDRDVIHALSHEVREMRQGHLGPLSARSMPVSGPVPPISNREESQCQP